MKKKSAWNFFFSVAFPISFQSPVLQSTCDSVRLRLPPSTACIASIVMSFDYWRWFERRKMHRWRNRKSEFGFFWFGSLWSWISSMALFRELLSKNINRRVENAGIARRWKAGETNNWVTLLWSDYFDFWGVGRSADWRLCAYYLETKYGFRCCYSQPYLEEEKGA